MFMIFIGRNLVDVPNVLIFRINYLKYKFYYVMNIYDLNKVTTHS